MDLLSYWRLKERPFEATWNTRFYYQTRDHGEALERLSFLVTEQSMQLGLLTGAIGSGKTLLQAFFVEQLDESAYAVVVQENSAFSFKDLLWSMVCALDGSMEGQGRSKYGRYERFKELARELHENGRHLVLIFDEAQEMSAGTLNELKLLTNFNGGGANWVTIILLGQPELSWRVSKLPAIDQRISLRYHLPGLSLEDTSGYLQHRLRVAGHPTGELFSPDAIERVFGASGGIPREINRLAKLSCEVAWLNECDRVTGAAVEAVVRDLERHQKLRVR